MAPEMPQAVLGTLLVAVRFRTDDNLLIMDGLTMQRLKLALKILSSRYDHTIAVTDDEVRLLKTYLEGDRTGMTIHDIAAAVIRRELDQQKNARRSKTA
jgi:hypothetical protein